MYKLLKLVDHNNKSLKNKITYIKNSIAMQQQQKNK